MDTATLAAATAGGALTIFHVASAAIAAWRCHPQTSPPPPRGLDTHPPVSIVRPLCGIDNYAEETLASAFTLDYPDYELILCVAQAGDPVIALARALMRRYPAVRAKLIVGDVRISCNPKLNNVVRGWDAARHDFVAIADSNVLMPPDYLQRLLTRWRSDTGLVCSPPLGCLPGNFWAELECAFLNGYQARWQLTADAIGFGFAQGKTMLWRRSDLDRAGGIRALACDLAEDAASTKVVRGLGLKVRLTRAPFEQPLGRRSFAETWRRQTRWAQLRRASFPPCYAAEILTGPAIPLAAIGLLAADHNVSIAAAVGALAALWYGAEMLLASLAGWHLSWRQPAAAVLRDTLLPVLWAAGWRGGGFVWRGNAMEIDLQNDLEIDLEMARPAPAGHEPARPDLTA